MRKQRSAMRLMAYMFFAYSTLTVIVSYMPVYFSQMGLSGSQVGWLLAIGPLASMFAQPFWGYMSDKYKTIKWILIITLCGSIISGALLFQMNSFISYLVMIFIMFSFMAPVTALGDSLAQKTALQQKVSFGSIRMWGSLGFGVSSLITGYVLGVIGVEFMMYPFVLTSIITLFITLSLADVQTTNKPVTALSAVKLGLNPKLFIFLMITVFISVTHRANDTYLGLYVLELGGTESLIGWAWLIGVTTEAIVLATSTFWFKRFHALTFISVAAFIYGLRWLVMGMVQDPLFILLLQSLHGVTFGMFYICGFHFISKLIPEHLQATGHVLFITTFFGLSGIIGSLVGGWMIEEMSGSALYYGLGVSALIGGVGIYLYKMFNEASFTEPVGYPKP